MMVVGIDPGTSCGWAVLEGGRRIASGTWDLRPRRHEGGGMRYLRARRLLVELLDSCPVGALGYEEVRRHLGTDAAHVYGGIVGQFVAVCEERSLPYRGVPVATAKRRATGKGTADKRAVMDAALRRWPGLELESDDEADALFVALALEAELGGAP